MKLIYKNYFNNSVKLIKVKFNKDNRGVFSQIYEKKTYYKIGINEKFIQDNFSFTKKKNTLRGLHFQRKPMQQAKLLTVLEGKILDVIVDLRKDSKYFGKYKKFILSKNLYNQIYIPKGFAHGFISISNEVKVIYKVNNYYSKKHEETIIWNDKTLNIDWNLKKNKPLISKKDQKGIIFNLL